MLHFKVCTAYSSPNKDKKLKSFVLWCEIHFAHKVVSVECSKSKTKSEHKVLFTKVLQHCALCGGKASLPIKANTAIGERHETWKGGLSFRKRQLFFL